MSVLGPPTLHNDGKHPVPIFMDLVYFYHEDLHFHQFFHKCNMIFNLINIHFYNILQLDLEKFIIV